MAASPWQDALEKVIALHAVHAGCVARLRHLACRPDVGPEDFAGAAARLREIVGMADLPDAEALDADPALHEDCRFVLGLARESPRLRERLRAGPHLDEVPREVLATLLELADLRPDPADGMTTSDAPFVRILRYLNNSGTVEDAGEFIQALLRDDLAHLIALAYWYRKAARALGRVAKGATWTAEMRAVEAELDRTAEGLAPSAPEGLGVDAVALLAGARRPAPPPRPPRPGAARPGPTEPRPTLASVLLQHPRFSLMTREEVNAFDRYVENLGGSSLFRRDPHEFSDRNQYRLAAARLLENPRWGEGRKDAEASLALRVTIANRFRDLRRVAKLDALERDWPDLYKSLENNIGRVIALEGFALRDSLPNQPATPGGDEDPYRADARLLRLLRLRPHVRDILPGEFEKYKEVSQQMPSARPRPSAGPTSSAMPPALSPAAPPSYSPLEIKIAGPLGISPETPGDTPLSFGVELLEPGRVGVAHAVSLKESDWAGELQLLERAQRGQGPAAPTRDTSREIAQDLNDVLKRIGIKLYDWFFQGDVRTRFDELLRQPRDYRVLLNLGAAPRLQHLPWEALYLPGREAAATLSLRTSLVRYHEAAAATTPPPFTTPLRVLVVIPTPEGLPPLEGAQEKQVLQLTLSGGPVQLKFLEHEKASLVDTQAALRDFRPNVFQFVGHGHFDGTEGKLIFQSGTGRQTVEPDKLANLLRDSMVGLAILNGCDTGRASSNDSLSSVAAAVVRAGVPAAIATMREVYDEAALLFSRVFYRAFVGGDSVEVSLAEARKALYNGDWNWSAYALFSGVKTDLNVLRLNVPSNRTALNP